MIEALK